MKKSVSICSLLVSSVIFFGCGSEPSNRVPIQEKDFCADIHLSDSMRVEDELADMHDLMQEKTGVVVLEDGGNSLITRAWLCENASKTIDIQYFIFSVDNVGLIACDYLVRAANRGVKVRILVDDIMVDADLEDILTMDSHKNIEVKVYNPAINLGKNLWDKVREVSTDFRSVNQRMHNKTFIVDGEVLITGGRNVADEYYDYDHEYNFRDRDVLLLGKACAQATSSFEEFWESRLSQEVIRLATEEPKNVQDADRFENLHQYACNPENFWPQIRERIRDFPQTIARIKANEGITWVDSVAFVSDAPGKNDGTQGLGGGGISTSALIELIQQADSSINIQTPYLITSEMGRDLFRSAVRRGVDVRILTNSLASTDNVEAFSSYQSTREELLATGVRIFEFRPDAAERKEMMTGALQATLEHVPVFGLHAKTMVIDGRITVIGTFNLDPRSANLNTECVAVIYSEKITAGVMEGVEREFQQENSWEITSDFNPDDEVGKWKRLNTWTRKILPQDIL
jgi:cardiolipin synthase C